MAVTIIGHAKLSLLLRDFPVSLNHHLPCDTLIFDMCIAVSKTLALRSDLIRRHFNFPSTFNKFFQFFCHHVLSRFNVTTLSKNPT